MYWQDKQIKLVLNVKWQNKTVLDTFDEMYRGSAKKTQPLP